MQILISCAKTMGETLRQITPAEAYFGKQALEAAKAISSLSLSGLKEILKVNDAIAEENLMRYKAFLDPKTKAYPALLAYQGIVFQHIAPQTMSVEELDYAQKHLFITSFLYGLLRPLDGIKPYRLEGSAVIDGRSRFDYWKPLLTDYLIDAVRNDDGILVNLASNEMKRLFDWKRLQKEVKIITPEFKTLRNGVMKSVVIHTKMLRGDMTRFILNNKPIGEKELNLFVPEVPGFEVDMELK